MIDFNEKLAKKIIEKAVEDIKKKTNKSIKIAWMLCDKNQDSVCINSDQPEMSKQAKKDLTILKTRRHEIK